MAPGCSSQSLVDAENFAAGRGVESGEHLVAENAVLGKGGLVQGEDTGRRNQGGGHILVGNIAVRVDVEIDPH